MRGLRTLGVAAAMTLGLASSAHAQRPASLGDGVPWGQSGIQLYDFANYLNNGAGEITCPVADPDPLPGGSADDCVGPPAPTTTAQRLERVFKWAQSKGLKNIELYGYPGNPFPGTDPSKPLDVAGLQALRALGDKYGIHFPARHGNLTEANWENQIRAARILGQNQIGEAGFPGNQYKTPQQAENTAALLNRLGKRSIEAGVGPVYFHNHQDEFNVRFNDGGTLKSAWEYIMDRTDPRYVSAQIDIGWAVCGLKYTTAPTSTAAQAMAEVTRLINKYGDRIISYHVKDMDGPGISPTCGDADQREIGKGAVDFAPMFAAAKNHSKYYLMERDPVGIGGPTNFNPFTNADNSLKVMRSAPVGTLYAYPPQFAAVAAGTSDQQPVPVTNDGDGPLSITGVNVQGEDFAVVSNDCAGKTLAAGAGCTVNVAFRPTRTNTASVARLQFASDGDDAMDRVLLAGRSTGDASGGVGGQVPATLSLTLGAPASFGAFVPGVARTYDATMSATVTSTAGDATLSVADPDTAHPGRLVNGSFALATPMQARANDAAWASVSNTPVSLLVYGGPVSGEAVTLGLRQAIGAGDPLRTGAYSKTLTFTLSTTAP